jgi:hypothetical protein
VYDAVSKHCIDRRYRLLALYSVNGKRMGIRPDNPVCPRVKCKLYVYDFNQN